MRRQACGKPLEFRSDPIERVIPRAPGADGCGRVEDEIRRQRRRAAHGDAVDGNPGTTHDYCRRTYDEVRAVSVTGDRCVKLEQVGDIIVRNMLAHVQKKFDRGLEFTDEGWRELAAFHASVLANARLAFNVLISRDPETARLLVHEKDRLRDREKQTSQSHFSRLRDGTARSVETSSIHLDTIRDLKQINSLLASMAYPVLEEQGLLTGSRLRAE